MTGSIKQDLHMYIILPALFACVSGICALPSRPYPRRLEQRFFALPGTISESFERGNSEYRQSMIISSTCFDKVTSSALKNHRKCAFDSHQIDLETLAPTLQRPMDSPPSVASVSDGIPT